MRRIQRILKGSAVYPEQVVLDHDELLEMARILRSMGCAIAYTEGVWDLYHRGHGAYLARGKLDAIEHCVGPERADQVVMVVGVDSDALTRKRKEDDLNRPVVPEEERCQVISYHRAVDLITVLNESEVFNRKLRPDVRIISESTGDNPDLEEMRQHCGHLIRLPPQSPTGTTARLRKLAQEGGLQVIDNVRKKLSVALEEAVRELA
ncbi:MAG: hypothetical protein KGI78_00015 [Patescibacteria group bacterium]|nr:hypothetical protein [Patescibacteria group bacterium]MDE1944769.1 hypothetical protein [Patescibacteria group bacterium]MDE2057222.1 hypothetical protein [Patescibacteria group bacterium]